MTRRDPDEEVHVPISSDEARILCQGLYTWEGPGFATDSIARAIGYRNASEMRQNIYELGDRIESHQVLTRRDWTRAIMALEISSSSDAGAGYEWQTVTGVSDERTIGLIRSLQVKLVGVRLQREWAEPLP